ncbi:sulfite exporter TauE/SafE family protein [Bacillus nitratireducens]|uniref:sulfite exporter TauE/SafE family protein n=1 Tax=Bacillus nitratireducens TaxID=2026193 RepID=UPI0005CC9FB3|nr:sulfite exporter TauE/SafE family protein [Bacillus nitratireducens]UNP77072.1 sulfite exporter TauE/SafE family protein [Bacillus nitratireducens]
MSLTVLLFIIGFIGSFISGMVGIGGAIINYPMILYIPVLLGFTGYTSHEVSGITAIQVFFATFAGAWAYRKSNDMDKTLVVYMGASILIGSFVGSFSANLLNEHAVNIVYTLLATIAAIMMFVPKKNNSRVVNYNKWLASMLAFIVGSVSGIIGAGGAFLLVPIMLVVLKLPIRTTIATSIAITFISSVGITTGKVITGQIVVIPALIVAIASLFAAPLGVRVGKRVNQKVLQYVLSILIVGTAIKMWIDMI